ncbi:KIF-binding protein-like [Diabrotica virgifera virgifera]|uniref:KIF-binding protein n=1 Tax=Diabrotica virgifera virgifera TaxID=50390 RepID=A0ABM5IR20_DIAVI|nr:KIF-binding protein-like [Diabrotica virgifera virgifera]
MEFNFENIVQQLKDEYQNTKRPSTIKLKQETQVGDSGEDTKKDQKYLEQEFLELEIKLDQILSNISKDTLNYCKILSIISSILYEKSKVSLNMNALTTSKAYLEKSLNIIKDLSQDPQIRFIYLKVVNYLSYVVSRMGDFEKARTLLEEVVKEELKFDTLVYSTEDLFRSTNSDQALAKAKLRKLKINNLQMLGWVYGKLGLNNLYAETIHESLQEELDINDGDPINWATRCYRLASLFIVQDKWINAVYHLRAAQTVLDPLETSLLPNIALFKAQADLARTWVQYGLQLFSRSRRSVMEKVWEDAWKLCRQNESSDANKFKFTGLEIHPPNVPVKEITNIQEARELFTYTHKWLKRARSFYNLRDYPLQYVNVIQELNELYRYLAFYEKDIDSQYEVHKKRHETLEMLSSLLREVRPTGYNTVSLEIVKEIIDVQLEMMQINLKRVFNPNEDTNYSQEEIKKKIEIFNSVNDKMGNLCKDVNNSSPKFVSDIDGLDHLLPSNILVKSDVDTEPDLKKESKTTSEQPARAAELKSEGTKSK